MTTQPSMQYTPHQQPGGQYVVMQQPLITAQFGQGSYPIYQTPQQQQYLTQMQGAPQQTASMPFMPYPTAASQPSTMYPASAATGAMYYQRNLQAQQLLQQTLQRQFQQPLQQPFQYVQPHMQLQHQHRHHQPQVQMQTQHLHRQHSVAGQDESHRVAEQLLSLSDGNCSETSDYGTNSDDEMTTSTTITTTQTTRSVIDTQPVKMPTKRRGRGPGKKNKGHRMKRDTTNTPRRYCCTIPHCDKRFISPSKLRRHMLVHNGIKQYGCRVCHSRFGQKSALVVHLKRKHPHMLEQALNQMAPKTEAGANTEEAVARLTSSGSDTPHDVNTSTVSEDIKQQQPSPRHASGSQSPPPAVCKKEELTESQNHA